MLDSSLQYGIPQALIPPALIPPEKKKDWKDKLGQMLIQGDSDPNGWQPDDATRRQMVKKGLLEAGLSMLANPSGYGNSPLIGISGGLLKGIGQMNNEADQLRGNQLNVNGNRLTDYQRKIQALQDPNTPEDVKQAIRISFGMDPRAINETWTSSLNPDGSLKASSNKGNVSILPVGQTTPQQFNLTGNPPPTAPAPPKPIVPTVTEVEAIGTQMLNNQIPPNEVNAWKAQQIALIQASQGMGNYGATQTQAPPVTQAPPSRIVTEQPTGGLPDTRKTETLTPYQSASLKLQQEASDRAKADSDEKRRIAAENQKQKLDSIVARKTEATGQSQRLVQSIESLMKMPGYAQLGTSTGNLTDRAIPIGVVTDYRDAKATLENIQGKIAIDAMASLKALSSVGATGFGALSEKELELLKNSLESLSTSQSNPVLTKAMQNIVSLKSKYGNKQNVPMQKPANKVGRFSIVEE